MAVVDGANNTIRLVCNMPQLNLTLLDWHQALKRIEHHTQIFNDHVHVNQRGIVALLTELSKLGLFMASALTARLKAGAAKRKHQLNKRQRAAQNQNQNEEDVVVGDPGDVEEGEIRNA